MRKGKKDIFFRMNEDEYEIMKSRFDEANGIGNFFLLAAREFSDVQAKDKLEAGEILAAFYKKFNAHLSHIGGNLNQRMKHCNELAKIGELSSSQLLEQTKLVEEIKILLTSIQNDIFSITKIITNF